MVKYIWVFQIVSRQTQGTQALNECRIYYKLYFKLFLIYFILFQISLSLRDYLPHDRRRALEVVIREWPSIPLVKCIYWLLRGDFQFILQLFGVRTSDKNLVSVRLHLLWGCLVTCYILPFQLLQVVHDHTFSYITAILALI